MNYEFWSRVGKGMGDDLINQFKKNCDELIDVLHLEPNKEGLYSTAWGKKTKEGLKETIVAIIIK